MFEFAWPWIFVLLPLPWLMRLVLPVADSGHLRVAVLLSAIMSRNLAFRVY